MNTRFVSRKGKICSWFKYNIYNIDMLVITVKLSAMSSNILPAQFAAPSSLVLSILVLVCARTLARAHATTGNKH